MADEQKLPPLRYGASGALCTLNPEDNTGDGIDRTKTDFMREKLQRVINSGEIYEEGWAVYSRGYATFGSLAEHHNLVLTHNGEIFATLDTQQIDRETGEIKGYFPGGDLAAPVIDDCTKDNAVVGDHNEIGETLITHGRGVEALLDFARAAEAARIISETNPTYDAIPDAEDGEINSDTLGREYAQAASGGAILPPDGGYSWRFAPGLGIELPFAPPQQSYYDQVAEPDDIVNNPDHLNHLLADLEALHPITQQKRAMAFGKQMEEQAHEPPEAISALLQKPPI